MPDVGIRYTTIALAILSIAAVGCSRGPNPGSPQVQKAWLSANKQRNSQILPQDYSDVQNSTRRNQTYTCSDDCEKIKARTEALLCNDSPFSIVARTLGKELIDYARDLHFTSVRLGGPSGIIWDIVQGQGYVNDANYRLLTENGIEITTGIHGGNPVKTGKLESYRKFVRQTAERYDGDGYEDAPGSPVITYMEIDNEPDLPGGAGGPHRAWTGDPEEAADYALILKIAYNAIKEVAPAMRVSIAGMAYDLSYYERLLQELEHIREKDERYFDVFNYHYYGPYDFYGQATVLDDTGKAQGGVSYQEVSELLKKYGYHDIPIIITETGTFFGRPSDRFEAQTQVQQAENLLKKYIYYLSQGTIDRVAWFHLNYTGGRNIGANYFNKMALEYEHEKTLSYYTYKLLTDTLESSEWNAIERIQANENVSIYKFPQKDSRSPVYVAWWDYWEEAGQAGKRIALNVGQEFSGVHITATIPNDDIGAELDPDAYPEFFEQEQIPVVNGIAEVQLGMKPVFIEAFP